eukprot:TRINITY_DN11317_c0_g1_i11.p1 TRINITY_DN11317_c0_g1~~TRINITY_DN11317_c0_g1_i11.p1  ORF type:complete len:1284 (-),score=233.84 TRINITY_DN11317_c0_g1_i11:85-3936(-)
MAMARQPGRNHGINVPLAPYLNSVLGGEPRLLTVSPLFKPGAALPFAVLSIERSPAQVSRELRRMVAPSPGSTIALLEPAGEVIARDRGQLSLRNTAGAWTKANATLMQDQLGTVSANLLEEFRTMPASHGQYSGRGAMLWASAPAATRVFIPPWGILWNWTLVQAVPRRVFFDSLDDSLDVTFATLVFAPAALLFVTVVAFRFLEGRLQRATEITEAALAVVRHSVSTGFARSKGASESEAPCPGEQEPVTKRADEPDVAGGDLRAEDNVTSSQGDQDTLVHVKTQRVRSADQQEPRERSWTLEHWLFPKNPLDCTMDQLVASTRETLRPLVACWEDASHDGPDSDALDARMKAKSTDYFKMVAAGVPLHGLCRIEAYYGEDSFRVTAYKVVQHPICRGISSVAAFSLLVVEVAPRCPLTTVLDLLLASVVTADVLTHFIAVWTTSKGIPAANVIPYLLLIALWHAILVPIFVEKAQDVHAVAFVKPLVVMLCVRQTRAALRVFAQALVDVKAVFGVFLCVVVHAAIMMLLLFKDKYRVNTTLGLTADSFTDSFVAMFIFITSGENWTQIVYPMYEISKVSAIFFLTYAVLGIFVLTALVLATFQTTYGIHRSDTRQLDKQERAAALCCAYALCTWREGRLTQTAFVDLLCAYWGLEAEESEFNHSGGSIEAVTDVLRALLVSMEGTALSPKASEAALSRSQAEAEANGGIKAFRIMLARLIFHTIDADRSGVVDFQEFQEVFGVVDSVRELQTNKMLGLRVIAARWEIDLEDATSPETIDNTERIFKKSIQDVWEQRGRIEDRRRVLGNIGWREIDSVLILVQLCHAYTLSLYPQTLSATKVYSVSCGFTAMYTLEMVLRIRSCGGLGAYLNDSLRICSSWANRAQLVLVGTSALAEGLYLTLSAEYNYIYQAVMALVLYRTLLLTESFAQPLHSLWCGLKPALVYVQLFVLVYYLFSLMAWRLFDGALEKEAANFNTLGDSMLLMFQVFVGEGWHEVMQVTTERSKHVYMCFFMVYVLTVGILFANLFMGIIIETYQLAERRRSTYRGKVDVILSSVASIPDDKRKRLYKNLGDIAALMYNPVMHSLDGLPTLGHKFRKAIETKFDGDLEKWAVVTIQRAFRDRKAARLRAFFSSVEATLARLGHPRSYQDIREACEVPWSAPESAVQPGAHLATVLGIGVLQRLGLPESILRGRVFRHKTHHSYRSWDMYGFMLWVIPPILAYLESHPSDQPLGPGAEQGASADPCEEFWNPVRGLGLQSDQLQQVEPGGEPDLSREQL